MIEINALLKMYRDAWGFEDFYDRLYWHWKDHFGNMHTPDGHDLFLTPYGTAYNRPAKQQDVIRVTSGDRRVDLPVWCGKLEAAKRIVVLGMEPRATKDVYNLEKINGTIFASPFAIGQGRAYAAAFAPLYNAALADTFLYFTDVVKDYDVVVDAVTKLDRKKNDQAARSRFDQKAQRYLPFLATELALIAPTIVLSLGTEVTNFLRTHFENPHLPGPKYRIRQIPHPAHGNAARAAGTIADILDSEIASSNKSVIS